MIHLGNITKINGATAPIVDCTIGGSPCQDLSIAGERAGFSGERSVLFLDQVRVTKEMRYRDRANGRTDEFIRPDTWSGKTSPERSAPTEEKTLPQSSKKRSKSQSRKPPLFLYLKRDGPQAAASWVKDGALLGEYSTHSFGESPKDGVESRLSQILEDNPHPKYYLSAKACRGILNRAERRGKDLPEALKTALLMQSEFGGDVTEAAREP